VNFEELVDKSRKSTFYKWLLNVGLHRKIPFNKPHGLWVEELSESRSVVSIPYKRPNLNHLKGLHACVLATAGEYASGLLILQKLGIKNYRIIMESLSVKYTYQGKAGAKAVFEISEQEIREKVIGPLKEAESTYLTCEIPITDADENLLCTVTTRWQIKSWDKVRLKV
jgi:acyl-coenzyme A thioesterase PaaI-like protein